MKVFTSFILIVTKSAIMQKQNKPV